MRRVRAYEKHFRKVDEKGDGPDNQAHAAYLNLVKLAHAVSASLEKGDSGASSKEKVKEVLRDVYGIGD